MNIFGEDEGDLTWLRLLGMVMVSTAMWLVIVAALFVIAGCEPTNKSQPFNPGAQHIEACVY